MKIKDKIVKLAQGDYSKVTSISKKLDVSPLLIKSMINRGINDVDEMNLFLNPKIEDMYDPFLLKDVEKAIDRIIKAINEKENVWIYGDYDVDGVTSISLFKIFFKTLDIDVEYYIPDRAEEGYGLNHKAIDYIVDRGGQLIITVDCGITSNDVVEYCNGREIDIIITDHHQCQGDIPDAFAVINPNRLDDEYPFKSLCGAGVVFKIIQGLTEKLDVPLDYKEYLPIVAIGTIADIVPLVGENRIISKLGLEYITSTNNKGIKALMEITGLRDKKITSGHIGFVIGPRLNAAGRIGSADYGVELLTSEKMEEAIKIAKLLDEENKKRQEIQSKILKEAEEYIENNIDLENDKFIVLSSEHWHHGVIGIVSSKITEKYYRPSILISIDGEEGRGSARSIPTFDIFESLKACEELFDKFGGHKQAAGLSINRDNIEKFKEKINTITKQALTESDLIPEIKVESLIELEDVSIKTIKEIKKLEPFGMGNPSPVFFCRNLLLKSKRLVGKESDHLKLLLSKNEINIDGIAFNQGEIYDDLETGNRVDIVAALDINKYLGEERIQLLVKDIKNQNRSIFMDDGEYYRSFRNSILNLDKSDASVNENEKNKWKDIKNKFRFAIDKIKDNNKTLVFVNNKTNVLKLLRELEFSGRDVVRKTKISYNYIDKNFENNIIINPIMELPSKYEDFQSIIFLDICFNLDIINRFINNPHEKDIYDLVDSNDLQYNKAFLDKVAPTLDELRYMYKTLINEYKAYKIDKEKYIMGMRDLNMNLNDEKFTLALEIFKESEIFDFKEIDGYVYIKNLRNRNKVNIKEMPTYKGLKNAIINMNNIKIEY
ncbi:single-stranded-DNA-specific exonuclease RecJ [Clostridiisalibacter paucivorans]|uniref:single-stranded-DNA-specific exonuclease RecJ n=1 Tax=Clostridiisalibacter paucivorans TaxID=408753 RepID=UPI00068478F8|nr:single-stranded-DNA-specific exonuclease RecJ [Clostridiisalibacter paucivorans]